MKHALTLALKDLRLLSRDHGALFFTLVMPFISAIFFGLIFASDPDDAGGDGGLHVVLVDEDQTESSAGFARLLDERDDLRIEMLPTREEAQDRVRLGRSPAMLVLERGFGERLDNPFWGGGLVIGLGMDPSRRAEAGMMQGILMDASFGLLSRSFTDSAAMDKQLARARASLRADQGISPAQRLIFETFFTSLDALMDNVNNLESGDDPSAAAGDQTAAWQPVNIKSIEIARERAGPRNTFEITFAQGVVWALMACAAGWGVSLVSERQGGTMTRIRTAPLTFGHILLGKAVGCFMTTVAITAVVLGVGIIFFGVRPDSYPLLFLAVFACALGFVGLMMLLATIGKTEAAASPAGWAIFMIMAALGGGMIPLAMMPGWMQTLSNISPVKWTILAIEGALWRQFTLADMLKPVAIMLVIGVVAFALGVLRFRRTA